MICNICNQEVEYFHGKTCIDCYPVWWERNKKYLHGFGCIISGCSVKHQNTLGMCASHNLIYWAAGGKNPNPMGKWFNPDGSRKTCTYSGCDLVVYAKGMCKHHAGGYFYEKGRGKYVTRKNKKRVNPDGSFVQCSFEGCLSKRYMKDVCAGHYYQLLRGEELTPIREKTNCLVSDCENMVSVKLCKSGLCGKHKGFMTRFSLTLEEVLYLYRPENRYCWNPGCGSTEKLHMDHDHSCCPRKGQSRSCGECVRGWLCLPCNLALGYLQENPRIIQGLLAYIEGENRPTIRE